MLSIAFCMPGIWERQPPQLVWGASFLAPLDCPLATRISLHVALTAPYMHDADLASLKQILNFYIGGGNAHPNLDKEIRPLDYLTGQERRDLLAFLNSLTGDILETTLQAQ